MAKNKKNSRGYSGRKVNIREVKQRFLIVCGGEETEKNYFDCFRVPGNVIRVKGLNKDPDTLINKTSDTIYDDLFNRQETAIKNAEKLLKQYHKPNPAQDNPSTTVHLLVKALNQQYKK